MKKFLIVLASVFLFSMPAYAINIETGDNLIINDDILDDSYFASANAQVNGNILGDLYKEFNWERLDEAFQVMSENDILIIALHKNKYCKQENKIGLDLGPFVTALEYATSKKSILISKPEPKFL